MHQVDVEATPARFEKSEAFRMKETHIFFVNVIVRSIHRRSTQNHLNSITEGVDRKEIIV